MTVDSHAHLDFPDFDDDRDAVIARAVDAGVDAVIVPGVDLASSRRAIELAERYPQVYAAVGIHPNEATAARPGELEEIVRLTGHPRVVAIGEIGLDLYRDRTPRDIQAETFRAQLRIAREAGKPVIVHFREVEEDGFRLAGEAELGGLTGVFHCFGGGSAFARRVLEAGFHVGFDGPVTYPNFRRQDVVRAVPADRLLIETDAPFMAPQRCRGKRNEPAYVLDVAEGIARITGGSAADIAAVAGANARKLFRLPAA